jgi:hypothetical protein
MVNIEINFIEIKLVNSDLISMVDLDAGILIRHKWSLGTHGYAVSSQGYLMHRLILGAKQGMDVDHINRNRLDNRYSNLRIVERSYNLQGKKDQSRSSSKYIGVSWDKSRGKWASRIKHPVYGSVTVGRFRDEVEAALAYNEIAKRFYGPNAKVNIILSIVK